MIAKLEELIPDESGVEKLAAEARDYVEHVVRTTGALTMSAVCLTVADRPPHPLLKQHEFGHSLCAFDEDTGMEDRDRRLDVYAATGAILVRGGHVPLAVAMLTPTMRSKTCPNPDHDPDAKKGALVAATNLGGSFLTVWHSGITVIDGTAHYDWSPLELRDPNVPELHAFFYGATHWQDDAILAGLQGAIHVVNRHASNN